MPLYFVCLVWLLTWSGVNPVYSCLNKSFGLPFIRVCLICKPRVTEYFANMQTADIKEIISAVSNQGAILNQHNQLFESLTHFVGSLTQQQSEQQQQLVSIANSLKEITSQLQSMNAGGSRETNPSPVVSLPTPTSVFPVSKPDKFDGSPDQCRGFLLQCSIFFSNSAPSSDAARISFFISRLTGRALEWATAIWPQAQFDTYDQFVIKFKSVFDHPHEGRSQGELLVKLRQRNRSVADYALEFRTLAAGSGWNEPALIIAFRNGLNSDILSELACRDDGLSLEGLINLAIRLDQLRSSRTSSRPSAMAHHRGSSTTHASPASISSQDQALAEPMQCDSTRLSQEERLRRLQGGLCMYCGVAGHVLRDCRARPHRPQAPTPGKRVENTPRANVVSVPTRGLVTKSFQLPVTLCCLNSVYVFSALMDSGADRKSVV